MIEPKNLRYGNVVRFENDKVPEGYTQGIITGISSQIIGGHSYYNENADLINDFWKLDPVPLTKEWLLKFGFKPSIDSLELNLKKGLLSFDEGKMYLMFGQFAECTDTVPCDYVHQIQNLYFVLTNEELKLTK